MLECIYSKRYGGKWWRLFCVHSWVNTGLKVFKFLRIEQNECFYCRQTENLILINWEGGIDE